MRLPSTPTSRLPATPRPQISRPSDKVPNWADRSPTKYELNVNSPIRQQQHDQSLAEKGATGSGTFSLSSTTTKWTTPTPTPLPRNNQNGHTNTIPSKPVATKLDDNVEPAVKHFGQVDKPGNPGAKLDGVSASQDTPYTPMPSPCLNASGPTKPGNGTQSSPCIEGMSTKCPLLPSAYNNNPCPCHVSEGYRNTSDQLRGQKGGPLVFHLCVPAVLVAWHLIEH